MDLRPVLALSLLIAAGAPPTWAQETCEDSVYVTVEDNTIHLFHDGALYNCCPSFHYETVVEEDLIDVHEIDQGLHPCRCFCCMDLAVCIGDVAPGDYTLRLYSHQPFYDPDPVLVAEIPVTVDDRGEGRGEPVVVSFSSSGCLEGTTDPGNHEPDFTVSWSTIKVFYR